MRVALFPTVFLACATLSGAIPTQYHRTSNLSPNEELRQQYFEQIRELVVKTRADLGVNATNLQVSTMADDRHVHEQLSIGMDDIMKAIIQFAVIMHNLGAPPIYPVTSTIGSEINEPNAAMEARYTKPENIQAALDSLQTGDVLLFNMVTDFAQVTHILSQSGWDHAGIVVVQDGELHVTPATASNKYTFDKTSYHPTPPCPNMSYYSAPTPGQQQIFEAGGEGTYAWPLREVLAGKYPVKAKYIYARRLQGVPLTDEALAAITALEEQKWGAPYDHDYVTLFRAVFLSLEVNEGLDRFLKSLEDLIARFQKAFSLKDDTAKETPKQVEAIGTLPLFCSELVARTLMAAGVLPSSPYDPKTFGPVMFDIPGGGGTAGQVDALLAKMGGEHSFSDGFLIKWPGLPTTTYDPDVRYCP